MAKKERDIKVPSLCMVDVSEMKFPLVCLYYNASDYPNIYVSRIWESTIPRPTNIRAEYSSLEQAREDILAAGYKIRIKKSPEDLPCVVESYIK